MRNNHIIFSLFTIILAGCGQTKIIRQKTCIVVKPLNIRSNPQNCTLSGDYITIWIHGTRLTPRCILRRIFHSPDGLVPAQTFDTQYHLRSIADTLAQADPKNYAADSIFLFGWSGALGFQERFDAAKNLSNQLEQLIKAYTLQHNKQPKIRIITHSHGGNIALNLAKVQKNKNFKIDELILLACPVQQETAHLIKDPLFQEVFVLYSSLDLLQVIDPQGLYNHNDERPLFSQRRFPIAENSTQIKLKINGRALLHTDFIRLNFVAMLPEIIDQMKQFHETMASKKLLIDPEVIQVLSITTKRAAKRH